MRKLLTGLAILALLLAGGWYGAEGWLARRAVLALTASPDLVAEVTPLRRPGRFGLHLRDLRIGDQVEGADLPGLDAYLPLTAPTTLRLDLPPRMELRPAGAVLEVSLAKGRAEAGIAPTRGLNLNHATMTLRDLAVAGGPALASADVRLRLTHMGVGAPAGAAVAYRLDLDAAGLTDAGLPAPLDLQGRAQLWLDAVPGWAVLAGGSPPPRLSGAQTQGLLVTLGGLQARLAGRVQADAQGFAAGQAAIYTKDGPAFVDAAEAAGLLPPQAAAPLRALLLTAAGEAAPADTPLPTADPETVTLPPAGPGEIRLPIFLSDGVMRLGPLPLGPAPRMPGY